MLNYSTQIIEIAEYLGCNSGELVSEVSKLLERVYEEGKRDGLRKNHEKIDGWVQTQIDCAKKLHDLVEEESL